MSSGRFTDCRAGTTWSIEASLSRTSIQAGPFVFNLGKSACWDGIDTMNGGKTTRFRPSIDYIATAFIGFSIPSTSTGVCVWRSNFGIVRCPAGAADVESCPWRWKSARASQWKGGGRCTNADLSNPASSPSSNAHAFCIVSRISE